MVRVLVVEDEANIREMIALNLRLTGMEAVEAESAEAALPLLAKKPGCDAAILDVMLPGMNGFSLCETIRRTDQKIGIIILSAKGPEQDKIRGLSIGADDYMTKPFSVSELLARVEALCRRVHRAESEEEQDPAKELGMAVYRTESGEVVMAACYLVPYAAEDVAALRLVTSLTLIERQIQNAFFASLVVVAAILIFSIMSGLYFVRSIVVPLGQVERIAADIARGEFDVRLPVSGDARDEVDRLRGTINRMAEGLEETEKMKNEFISSVSHELRTPLTSIRGWVETLRTLDDPTDENYRKGLEIINNETGRLYNMVEELLDFSRLQNGRLRMECRPLDLVAELTDAVLFCEARIQREGLILSYTEPEEMIPVYADPDRLRQVFINILDNAIKYSAPGGRITVKLWAGEYKAFVEILDQGRGIPPEDLENVKTKFYKGSNAVRGSGIGLALVDSIMTALDGTMDIQSTLGRGTVVTLGLPLYHKA